MSNKKKEIGLAIIGCGTIGRIRAMLAHDYPAVGWLGLCDINEDLGKKLTEDAHADFFTTDFGFCRPTLPLLPIFSPKRAPT